jgi:glycosyltransferase involved in cell wall biosynthesis
MKIGLVIYGSLATLSGGYLYDRQLVNHLRSCGDEVQIISFPWRNYLTHLTQNLQTPSFNLLSFDLLLQDELNHPSLFYLNRSFKGRVPIISIVHHLRISEAHPAWLKIFYCQIERAYLNSVDGFIFNSLTTKREVESLTRPRKSVVASPGGDRFNSSITLEQINTRATQSPFKILFVGNLIPRKGLHTLVEALHQVEGEWELTIVGKAVDTAYVNSLQLTPRMKLLGALSDVELAQQFSQTHLLVVPAQYEGFGIVYLEAMSFGVPVIATHNGAAREIVTHDENGFLIHYGEAATLAQHLRALIVDRVRLVALSAQALARYQRHPTWTESMAHARKFLSGVS